MTCLPVVTFGGNMITTSGTVRSATRGRVMPKKIAIWGGAVLAVFYVVTQPQDAAGAVRSIGQGLQSAAMGFSTFITNLT